MKLPEWANWLARDEDGKLWAFENKPIKRIGLGAWVDNEYGCGRVKETDDTFEDILWTDDEPVKVADYGEHLLERAESLKEMCDALNRNWEAEHGKPSVEEYNQWQITQAKAHGYDEPPIMNAKAHGYDEAPELVDKTERVHVENNMIDQPPHYIGKQGLEVEVVLQNFIPRYEDPYVGHRIASAIEYLLRSPLKNQRQDIEKAGKNIQQALAYLDMTEETK